MQIISPSPAPPSSSPIQIISPPRLTPPPASASSPPPPPPTPPTPTALIHIHGDILSPVYPILQPIHTAAPSLRNVIFLLINISKIESPRLPLPRRKCSNDHRVSCLHLKEDYYMQFRVCRHNLCLACFIKRRHSCRICKLRRRCQLVKYSYDTSLVVERSLVGWIAKSLTNAVDKVPHASKKRRRPGSPSPTSSPVGRPQSSRSRVESDNSGSDKNVS